MSDNDLPRRRFLAAGLAAGLSALAGCSGLNTVQAPATPPVVNSPGPGRLTIHAIDIWTGLPGAGMRVDLSMLEGQSYRLLRTFDTNKGGRTDQPLFEGETFKRGSYELNLHVEQHYARLGAQMPRPAFLTEVPIRFSIDDPRQRYHIAILLTPWSYSYYRGS
ncbi:MAG TPA: hydroxyisourate hydrolase [Noviherbaspirillum sp.]|nr:hydroxyisourate hydrolase [Noviherbaspirillum sp.]